MGFFCLFSFIATFPVFVGGGLERERLKDDLNSITGGYNRQTCVKVQLCQPAIVLCAA